MKAETMLPPVMVVDDDEDDVFLLARQLKTAGIRNPVLHFRDGGAAYVYLKERCTSPAARAMPAVMFLDVNMQGLSGFDVLMWARQQPALKKMKIFMLSGANETFDSQIAAKLGADDYLEKFPSPEDLQRLLATVCKLQTAAQAAILRPQFKVAPAAPSTADPGV